MSPLIRYRVEHETRYEHAHAVSTSQHVAWLTPRSLPYQQVLSHALEISPEPAGIQSRTDYHGNRVHQFAVLTPYTTLTVTSRSEVVLSAERPACVDSPSWDTVPAMLAYGGRSGPPLPAVAEFAYPSPSVPVSAELAAFARESFGPGRSLLDAARELMHRIHDDFVFDPAATTIATPVSDVLRDRRGVCQDFAHLQISALRSLGLPARYISGYLLTDPPPGQPRLIGADASHAWLSVWCPSNGWVDLDPTNGVVPGQRHVTLAWGRDYGDVSPLRGVVLGGHGHRLSVAVSVIPQDASIAPDAPVSA